MRAVKVLSGEHPSDEELEYNSFLAIESWFRLLSEGLFESSSLAHAVSRALSKESWNRSVLFLQKNPTGNLHCLSHFGFHSACRTIRQFLSGESLKGHIEAFSQHLCIETNCFLRLNSFYFYSVSSQPGSAIYLAISRAPGDRDIKHFEVVVQLTLQILEAHWTCCRKGKADVSSFQHQLRSLSERQSKIVHLVVAQRLRNAEIAKKMFVSVSTVKSEVSEIYRLLNVKSRSELIAMCASQDLTRPGTQNV
jgi:DNA-binding CsgD family transcriptional regulator